MPKFEVSNRENKKYKVITPSGKTVHFGDKRYEQYKDTTPLKAYSNLNHNDEERRKQYRARHSAVKTKDGTPAYKDPEKPSYYAYKYLW